MIPLLPWRETWRAGEPGLAQLGVNIAWCSVPLLMLVDVALPVVWLFFAVTGRFEKRRPPGVDLARNPARRALLERAALVVPVGALGLSVARA